MKTISKLMLGAMACGLFACSSDEPVADIVTPSSSEGDVYAAITLNLTTRSTTVDPEDSSDGTEVGTLAENNVDKILVVLATANSGSYDYVTAAYEESQRNNNASEPTYVVRFESQALAAKAEETVYVFTYCNPKSNVVDYFFDFTDGKYVAKDNVASFQDAVLKNADGNIWGDNQFLMTNYELCSKTLPSLETLTTVYNKAENPFDLGTIQVQRVAARFDIGQKPAADGLAANTYAITDPVNGLHVANITIDGIALFNQANDFYAFRHTSADGTDANWILCGKDIPTNYVVSPYFANMRQGIGTWISDSYTDALYAGASIKAPESYTFTALSSLSGDDNHDAVNGFNAGYTPWRYTTPNTIPAALNASDSYNGAQLKGYTTGVIYRGFISAVEVEGNEKLVAAMNDGDVLYAFDGVIYGDKEMLAAYVKDHPESGVARGFAQAGFDAENLQDLTAAAGGFTIYRPAADGKYYVYYYYYNQHNNRPNDTLFPMEFGVVRNNVYKLTVDNIYKFGHPGDPDDDDDPEDPEDPDEDEETFFKVSVKVLPWVVRINNIEF